MTKSIEKIKKTIDEWRKLLTPEQFSVTREKKTEQAHSGQYADFFAEGSYECACCGETLFDSTGKYDNDSGWPTFNKPANDQALCEQPDYSKGILRTEVTCNTCDAHLGHVFNDGPKTTGKRYSVNSAALKFTAKD